MDHQEGQASRPRLGNRPFHSVPTGCGSVDPGHHGRPHRSGHLRPLRWPWWTTYRGSFHHACVWAGKDERHFLAVLPPDQVGWRAVRTPQLDDLSASAWLVEMSALNDEPVANLRLHIFRLPMRIPGGHGPTTRIARSFSPKPLMARGWFRLIFKAGYRRSRASSAVGSSRTLGPAVRVIMPISLGTREQDLVRLAGGVLPP
jgi:hypothetical protein